ncbi:hypothetical protein [Marinitoga sp. 38H-ov]|uniref:hypothetical protein n=1 Tax=Marinitoga sp. 38H-ov TaxID=1755814 RepID=UPI0013EDD3ED|nr:hypothetical protein [Marinitoga sp. 38H-ov]KAF2955521.1 hypothetical protein AS160_10005 [Marinitoga sp. 38H-ov]
MKKSIIYILVTLMALLLLSGCLPKENKGDELGNNVLSLSELRNKILENKEIWNNYDSHEAVYEIEGIVSYQYTSNDDPTKNYIYIIDENGIGLKLTYLKKENHDGKYNIGDKLKVRGVPYYKSWGDPNVYELRMDIDNLGSIEVIEENYGIPMDKAKEVTSELSGNDFANLIKFTGKYTGSDEYNNKTFNVDDFNVIIDSHSDLPLLTPNSTYTIKGIVGQSYGYRVFVSEDSWVTVVATSEEQTQEPTMEASTIADIKNEIKENYDLKTDGWDSGDTTKVPLRNIENAIVVFDSSDYGYVYAISDQGTGIYVKVDSNENIELFDTINAMGRPYYTERDSENGIFEYRFNASRVDYSEYATVISNNSSIPWNKADQITINNLPGMNNLGNLVMFEGKYLGKDNYGHYTFDLNNDNTADVYVVKYSSMPTITEGNSYEIKGVVGYNYGFKIFVGDETFVTEK